MKFIDKPQPRTLEHYSLAIDEMTSRIRKLEGVLGIYQIGSVSNPGLSDIDMLVVFEDDAKILMDPVRNFQSDTYLFTHQVYGVPKGYWNELRSLTFFHNYRFIEGEELPELRTELDSDEIRQLKRQIALEFLVKMYIVLTVQLRYDIIKLRSFLLEGKALIYDLEFLGINSGNMFELVQQVIQIRADWWEKQPTEAELKNLIKKLYASLTDFLIEELRQAPLYLPTTESFQISRNISVSNGNFGAISSGFVLPNFGLIQDRKHFNLLNRFNRFKVTFPYSVSEKGSVVERRFQLLSQLRKHNSNRLPGFLIPASSLKVV
ncbi:MAG: hypothetical protein H6602_12275 [Flavobacteriales bacterium]|nr:hypothetical protein [Flavobacteriales bacterium]